MLKCPVCGKDKTEMEMRPLINVAELKAGNILSDQKSEREVNGAKLQMVCRPCWGAILASKTQEEVVEILETICGLLLEVERRRVQERASLVPSGMEEIVEKAKRVSPLFPTPTFPPMYPSVPQPNDWDQQKYPYIGDIPPGLIPGTSTPYWQIGTSGSKINMSSFTNLGDDLDGFMALVNRP